MYFFSVCLIEQFYYRDRERLSGADGGDTKGHPKGHHERYAGTLHSLQQHGHSLTGSRASSCNSLNRIATDNARAAHEKDSHYQHHHPHNHGDHHHHHHHHQHPQAQRHSNGGRKSPCTTHHDGNKQQHNSRQVDHHHRHQHPHPDVHNHEQNSHYHRKNHYKQEKSKVNKRVCRDEDAYDDVAVVPADEPAQESEALCTDGQNQSGSSATPVTDNTNKAGVSQGTQQLTSNAKAVGKTLTEGNRDEFGASPIATLPNSVAGASESTSIATPVLSIPVAPYSHPQKRHINDHVALQPIITLQRVPEHSTNVRPDGAPYTRGPQNQAPDEKVMRARTRHEKMLQRKMSDNDLSPFELTNQQLAAIIIHDLPVQASAPAVSTQDQSVIEGLPKC